jgi:hypothetical protein
MSNLLLKFVEEKCQDESVKEVLLRMMKLLHKFEETWVTQGGSEYRKVREVNERLNVIIDYYCHNIALLPKVIYVMDKTSDDFIKSRLKIRVNTSEKDVDEFIELWHTFDKLFDVKKFKNDFPDLWEFVSNNYAF